MQQELAAEVNIPKRADAAGDTADHLREYRAKPIECARTDDLMRLLPGGLASAIDIGARDGFISRLLAERVPAVTALDLERPDIDDPRVTCVRGNATALAFADASFDAVLCAEVLEHIPSPGLEAACAELARIAARFVLIGVPYKQDIRLGQTTCRGCGGISPPWAHVNSFDEARLAALFPSLAMRAVSYVGQGAARTNPLSAYLLNLAGNPYGTYGQDEGCIHCGAALLPPAPRTLAQKVYTRAAMTLYKGLARLQKPHANWIHVLFEKAPR